MSKFNEALAAARKVAKQVEPLTELVSALEGVESLTQMKSEIEASIRSARAELGELNRDIDAKRGQLHELALEVQRAEARREEVLADARARAAAIVKDAGAALEEKRKAEEEAVEKLRESQKRLLADIAHLEQQQATAKGNLEGLQRAIEDARKSLLERFA